MALAMPTASPPALVIVTRLPPKIEPVTVAEPPSWTCRPPPIAIGPNWFGAIVLVSSALLPLTTLPSIVTAPLVRIPPPSAAAS